MGNHFRGNGKYKVTYAGPQKEYSSLIEIAMSNNNIANEMSRANDLKEKELQLREKELGL